MKMENIHQQQQKQLEELYQSETTAEQEAKEMRQKVRALQHQVEELQEFDSAGQQRNQQFEHELPRVVEISRTLTCTTCQQKLFVANLYYDHGYHPTPVETMNRRVVQLPNSDFNIDYDKEGEPDAPWTLLGRFQTWHMHGIAETNLQNSSIDGQTCRSAGRVSLADETAPISDFGALAALAGVEANHPRLTLRHSAGDVWNTSQVEREEITMRDQCYLTPVDVRFGFAMDQRPEVTANAFSASVNVSPSIWQSSAFQTAGTASLCDFN